MSEEELSSAREFLVRPGIGVTHDARIAIEAGSVTAMHDPTEGGVVSALWELAEASSTTLRVDPRAIPIPALARRICAAFDIDPLCSIASGALIITVSAPGVSKTCDALARAGIACADIGIVATGGPSVQRPRGATWETWPRPDADAIAAVFAASR